MYSYRKCLRYFITGFSIFGKRKIFFFSAQCCTNVFNYIEQCIVYFGNEWCYAYHSLAFFTQFAFRLNFFVRSEILNSSVDCSHCCGKHFSRNGIVVFSHLIRKFFFVHAISNILWAFYPLCSCTVFGMVCIF